MNRMIVTLVLALLSTGVHASVLKASDLETLCLSKSEAERAVCLLVMRAFMDGFIEGVGKGVFGVYQHDPQVYELVKDIKAKDFAPRLKQSIDMSTCGQRVTSEMMAGTYTTYIRQHPQMRPGDYRLAMYRALTEKHCTK
jgi:hypothetical protein